MSMNIVSISLEASEKKALQYLSIGCYVKVYHYQRLEISVSTYIVCQQYVEDGCQ
jgi:hypothetical protein